MGSPRDRAPARSTPAGAATRRATPAGSAGAPSLGNRGLSRLVGAGGGGLAAYSAIAAAGNRAIQRLVDPVQRNEDEQQKQPPAPTSPQPVSATQQSHPDAGNIAPGAQQLAETGSQSEPTTSTSGTSTTGPDPSHAVNVVTNPYFRNGTTGTDLLGLGMTGAAATDVSLTAARFGGGFSGNTPKEFLDQMALGDLLPGVGFGLNVLGTAESVYRGQAAEDRRQAMSEGAARSDDADQQDAAEGRQPTRGRATEIFRRGAAEQEDERDARRTGAILGGTQAALTAAGIGLGPTPGGIAALASAGVLGVMKGGLAASRFVRKKVTSGNAAIHAQQVLFAAHSGDPAAIDTLKRLNVPTDNLDDPAVWQAAVAALSESMPRDEPRYRDGGSGVTGESVNIDDRRPTDPSLYEGIGPDSEDSTSSINPLEHDPAPQLYHQESDDAAAHQQLPPSADTDGGDGDTVALPIVRRPPTGSSVATTPNASPDRSPMSEHLEVEDVAEGEGQTLSALPANATANGFTGLGDWYM